MLHRRTLISFLISFLLISACSKGGDQETGMASVRLALSLEGENAYHTKAGSAVVQTGGESSFRGITDITLIPFATRGKILSTHQRLGLCEELSDIEELSTGNHGKLYPSQVVPYQTASFLFYGKAGKLYDDKAREGSLLASGLDGEDPSGILFRPEPIGLSSSAQQTGLFLANHLTGVARAATESESFATVYPELFQRFTNGGRLISGSSLGARMMLTDLYRTVSNLSGHAELNQAILNAIIDPFYMSYNATSGVLYVPSLASYPGDNLPDGASVLKWNGERFTSGDETGALLAPIGRYCYPISLWYYGNSTILTTDDDAFTADYLQESVLDVENSWEDVLDSFDNNGSFVGHNTSAIALEEPIRYGVGMLELTIQPVESVSLADAESTPVRVDNADFPLTGLILGGQQSQQYDFTASGSEDFYVYDTCFDQTAYISCDQAAVPIRTLAVESALDAVIHFALEFKNNSNEAFVGATGLVLPGSKFYLLGQLDLDTLTADQRTVEGVVRSKVFEKHRKTSVNVTIASLKDAYNIIPDLRQPQLQIGLHVDFNWNLSTPVNVPII